jgi:hypothetical protein
MRVEGKGLKEKKIFFGRSEYVRRFLIPPAEAGSIRNDRSPGRSWGEEEAECPTAFRLLFPPLTQMRHVIPNEVRNLILISKF